MHRRLSIALAAAASLLAAAPAAATPVKCAATDFTPDDRIFAEATLSTNFMRYDEFLCGIELLERTYPDFVELREIGTSKGGQPIYDVVLTDEQVGPPSDEKEKLLIMSSIHGDEVGGREGGARSMEDLLDPRFQGDQAWAQQALDRYAIHFVYPNPDGWVNGDVIGRNGAGVTASRGNETGRDLNRNFPVKGWIDVNNATLAEPESNAMNDKMFTLDGWFLGTDNHGQLHDTYAAAGLQIVGEFDYQKSETLARFADGITEGMKEYNGLESLEDLRGVTGQDLGAYHWGTLYDMLGYSASGSGIDYYNTPGTVGGTGFATELTVGREVNWLIYPAALNQLWVDSIRAINFTMIKQAIDERTHVFPVESKAAYLFDPARIRHDDANGAGDGAADPEDQQPYDVSRMQFFEDLNGDASRPLAKLRVADVLAGALADYDSFVLANDAMPEAADADAYYAELERWVQGGGNLIVTDGAAPALAELGLVPRSAISVAKRYVGFVTFPEDRSHPLNQGLRGVASQTYDTVPIGYRFGSSASAHTAPNWKVTTSAWTAAKGTTTGTNGSGQTIYGEAPLGAGRVRFLGALLPDPTEDFYHPYGLQNYAVTYTGYTLLENMLRYQRP